MKKAFFKKILNILDVIEIKGISVKEAGKEIKKELDGYSDLLDYKDICKILNSFNNCNMFKYTHVGIDLTPCATILGKSDANSDVESLAMFECLIKCKRYYLPLKRMLYENNNIYKMELYDVIQDDILVELIVQTKLFHKHKSDYYSFNTLLIEDLKMIVEEHKSSTPLLSKTLAAHFTNVMVEHSNLKLEYRNQDRTMVKYKYKDVIETIIPRRGIPSDRDVTKALQSFYKDSLTHEFDHECPICKADIPQMLIASHIKPFRDCAHIFEAVDQNNGILLCRNHDFLFDQGYFSFREDGKIMISNELQKCENWEQRFVLSENFILPKNFLTYERKLFLAYHRKNIFKG